jgi:hypothetical protein
MAWGASATSITDYLVLLCPLSHVCFGKGFVPYWLGRVDPAEPRHHRAQIDLMTHWAVTSSVIARSVLWPRCESEIAARSNQNHRQISTTATVLEQSGGAVGRPSVPRLACRGWTGEAGERHHAVTANAVSLMRVSCQPNGWRHAETPPFGLGIVWTI